MITVYAILKWKQLVCVCRAALICFVWVWVASFLCLNPWEAFRGHLSAAKVTRDAGSSNLTCFKLTSKVSSCRPLNWRKSSTNCIFFPSKCSKRGIHPSHLSFLNILHILMLSKKLCKFRKPVHSLPFFMDTVHNIEYCTSFGPRGAGFLRIWGRRQVFCWLLVCGWWSETSEMQSFNQFTHSWSHDLHCSTHRWHSLGGQLRMVCLMTSLLGTPCSKRLDRSSRNHSPVTTFSSLQAWRPPLTWPNTLPMFVQNEKSTCIWGLESFQVWACLKWNFRLHIEGNPELSGEMSEMKKWRIISPEHEVKHITLLSELCCSFPKFITISWHTHY